MELFEHYRQRANAIELPKPKTHTLPLSPTYYATSLNFVDNADLACKMVELASQIPLSHIGMDCEYAFDAPGVEVKNGNIVYDPRSIHPLLLAITLATPPTPANGGSTGTLFQFVVDFRRVDVLPALQKLFRLPICFVGHALHGDLACLLQKGLPEPTLLWDTQICEKALNLGRHHKKYRLPKGADEAEEARIAEEVRIEEEHRNSLLATCGRYGVPHRFANDKERLQTSFLSHTVTAPFSDEQIAYAAEDAIATARIYHHQIQRAAAGGILQHLITVEMPWVVTNARMSWHGVRVDAAACQKVRITCDRHMEVLRPQLEEIGVTTVNSHPQLLRLFYRLDLLDCFRKRGVYSFTRDLLDDYAHLHPAINIVRATRRILQLQSDNLIAGTFIGVDGRVHPRHRQLGADTGRQSCSDPNILGLGRIFRPLIIPEVGRSIGETELSQIEVGLAGAVYHDDNLVRMFNSGDVYSAMVREFYRAQLTDDDLRLPDKDFKKKFEALRNKMKRCTLGILYGLTPHGLALYLGIKESEAKALQKQFLGMFPDLERALEETWRFAGWRGFATTVSGLRRHRAAGQRSVSRWERNWMVNHGVQGSAAVAFKAAGNRLDKLYRQFDAWIIVALHDAYVFEAPLGVLSEVASLTERVLCETVREYFPQLNIRAETSIESPDCWNKRPDSLQRWLADPTYRLD